MTKVAEGAERQAAKGTVRLGRTEQRPYWVLMASVLIRALHQIGAAVFLCAFLPGMTVSFQPLFFWLAVLSGLLLLATEALRHRQIHREVAGAVTFGKCLLLGLAFHGLLPSTPAVVFAFLVASIGAHAPKHIRHRLLA